MPLLKLLGVLCFLLVGVSFAVMNDAPVLLDLYVVQWSLPLSVVLLLAMGSGLLLGSLLSLLFLIRIKRENSRLKRERNAVQQEIANLRTLPVKEL